MSRRRKRSGRGRKDYAPKEQKKQPITTWKYADGTYKRSDGTTGHINDITPKKATSYGGSSGGSWSKYSRWCDHWQHPVPLMDGLTVYASAYSDRPNKWSSGDKPVDMGFTPDIGFYLDEYWMSNHLVSSPGFVPPFVSPQPTNIVISYPWVDRWIPNDIEEVKRAVIWLLEQMKEGKTVDIGCMGGHGRTGTMIACLLVGQGVAAGAAVRWVRSKHCSQAIETTEQARFVGKLSRLFRTGDLGGDIDAPFEDELRDTSNPNLKEYGTRSNKHPYGFGPHGGSEDSDDFGYREWWRMNDEAIIRREMLDYELESEDIYDEFSAEMALANDRYREEQDQMARRKLDAACDIPPCILPGECNPEEGDCWIRRCHGISAVNREEYDWEDWSERDEG